VIHLKWGWAGVFLLKVFGVGIPSLQVAGGLMIGLISLSMLQSNQSPIQDSVRPEGDAAPDRDIAIVPLALPMIAGPGAMVTVIVSTHQNKGVAANLEMTVVCALLAAVLCVG
jgi:multiple antibiotic resistance protein